VNKPPPIETVSRDTPDAIIEQFIAIIKENWGDHYPSPAPKLIEDDIRASSNPNRLPLFFYILDPQKKVIATASLVESDIDLLKEYTPWLANVYVDKAHRNQGLGAYICNFATQKAKELKVKTLYLFTEDKKDWYAKQSWNFIKEITYLGVPQYVMSLDLEVA